MTYAFAKNILAAGRGVVVVTFILINIHTVLLMSLLRPLVIHGKVFVKELLAEVFIDSGHFHIEGVDRVLIFRIFAIFAIKILSSQVLQSVALLTSQALFFALSLDFLVLDLLASLHLLVEFHYPEQTDESNDSNDLDDF